MDWVWRICLGFAAIWLVNNTNIWLIADSKTDGGFLINSLFYGLIATLGCLPLIFKFIHFGDKNNSSKKQNRWSSETSSIPLALSGGYNDEKIIEEKNEETSMSLNGKVTQKKTNFIDIKAPAELDYSKRCIIHWYFDEGDTIQVGKKIFTITETLAYDEEKKTFTLTADKDYILESRNVGVTKFDTQIQNAGTLLCTLCTFEEKPLKPQKKRISKPESDSQAKKRTKKQITADLNTLKELKKNGLISDEVWKEKQREILKDY